MAKPPVGKETDPEPRQPPAGPAVSMAAADPWASPAQNWTMPKLTTASGSLPSNSRVDPAFTKDLNQASKIVVGKDDLEALVGVIDEQIRAGRLIPDKAKDGNKQSGGDGGSNPLGSRSMSEANQLYGRLKGCYDGFVANLNAELAQLKVAADGLNIV